MAKQAELEKATPQLQITEEVLSLVIPGHTIGEAVGVAKNSKGHLFVFTRSGNVGPAQGRDRVAAVRVRSEPEVRQAVGPGQLRRVVRAHRPRRQGRQRLDDRRRLEHDRQVQPAGAGGDGARPEDRSDRLSRAASLERGEQDREARYPAGGPGTFNRPTDVTWDTQGNIFVVRRLQQLARRQDVEGRHLGEGARDARRGAEPVQHAARHHLGRQGQHLRRRSRQPPHPGVRPRAEPVRRSSPTSARRGRVCTTPGPTQYLFSGDGNGKIYKLDLNGKLVGWAQTGLGHGQAGCLVHELHCESENVIYKGDCSTWTVEKITIKGTTRPSAH